jgi:hypothetical protein
MELLPALALSLGFTVQFCLDAVRKFTPRKSRARWKNAVGTAFFVLVALNGWQMLRECPLVYVEGTKNIAAHEPYEREIPPLLRALLATRPGGVVLTITSNDPEVIALTGIPLRQTINESDLEIYRQALTAPAAHAALVLAFDGDEVDQAVHLHPSGLTVYRRFSAPNQPSATLYVCDTPGA